MPVTLYTVRGGRRRSGQEGPKGETMSYQEDEITDEASDAELIERARAGGDDAVRQLWERHARASYAAARRISGSFDADDLVQEAFARTLTVLRKGSGPIGPFRPYLYAAMRNISVSWARRGEAEPVESPPDLVDPTSDFGSASLDRMLAAHAFRTLPDDWRTVLWYADVEGLGATEIAPLVGLSPGAVASLAYRAREGLRRAWIQVHIADVPTDEDCRWVVERMPRLLRGALSPGGNDRVQDHLSGCLRCTLLLAELDDVRRRLRVCLLPLVLGAGVIALDGPPAEATASPAADRLAEARPPASADPGDAGGAASVAALPGGGATAPTASHGLVGSVSSAVGIAAVTASLVGLVSLAAGPANVPLDAAPGIAALASSPGPAAPPGSVPASTSPTGRPGGDGVVDPRPLDTAVASAPADRETVAPGSGDRDGTEDGASGGTDVPGAGDAGSPDEQDPSATDAGSSLLLVTDVVRERSLRRVLGTAPPGVRVEAVTPAGDLLAVANADPRGTFVLELGPPTAAGEVLVRVSGGDQAAVTIPAGPGGGSPGKPDDTGPPDSSRGPDRPENAQNNGGEPASG